MRMIKRTVHQLPASYLSKRISVCVIGAGGNGGQMLTGLAKLHMAMLALGHPHGLSVKVYDGDTVSESNVGRQLYYHADIGKNKAEVLVQRINVCYGLDFEAVPMRFSGNRLDAHIVIGCVDSAASRRQIHQCHGWDYWLDLGNADATGQVVLGQHWRTTQYHRLPTVVDLFPELLDPGIPDDDAPSCSLAEALERQELFVNQSVSVSALNMLWTWFRTGELDYSAVFVNLRAGRVTPLPIDEAAWRKRFGYKVAKKRLARPKQSKIIAAA